MQLLPEIRVAIAGVGNCASALIQGVEYYRHSLKAEMPGLMHVDFGGYHVGDIRFVAAFEANEKKVGKDLSDAIWVDPNMCTKFADVPRLGVEVMRAPALDGVAKHMRSPFHVSDVQPSETVDIPSVLTEVEADMLVNFLPVGSQEATRFYAQACLDTECAFVNCMPEFIASDNNWGKRFEEKNIVVAGDDIKSQLGATILHRNLVRLCADRGIRIEETYQLNLGGNTDFQNMTVEDRLKSKRISKTEAVTSLVPYDVPTRIGPSDYVPFLKDKKICYLFIQGRKFGDQKITLRAKLEVEDSPNSAGVVIDVIRAVKLAQDRKVAGPLISISSYAFKHPPMQVPDDLASRWVEDFIAGKRER